MIALAYVCVGCTCFCNDCLADRAVTFVVGCDHVCTVRGSTAQSIDLAT